MDGRRVMEFCIILIINVRENRKDNQELTIQKHRHHWAHKTQGEDKQNNTIQHSTAQKAKRMSNTDRIKKSGVNPDARER